MTKRHVSYASTILVSVFLATAAKAQPTSPETPPAVTAEPATLAGKVIDKATQKPVDSAVITVLDDTGTVIVTDEDGKFSSPVPPGNWQAVVTSGAHLEKTLELNLKSGVALQLTIELDINPAGAEEITVVGTIDNRSESAQLAVRRSSATIVDTVSSQEIARNPDSNAGDAIKRSVSATVVDGKYVALRGLEGRYVSTLLNGVLIPSPEPDRNAVPLDMFPASLLSSLTVAKTYDPSLPGSFGGGALLIDTNTYPDRPEFKVQITGNANTHYTYGNAPLNAATGAGAAAGYGFFGNYKLDPSVTGNTSLRPQDGQALARNFGNDWTPQSADVRPTFGALATGGTTWRLGNARLGFLASAMAKSSATIREGTSNKVALSGGELTMTDDIDYVNASCETSVGGLINTGLKIKARHTINLLGLYTHVGESMANVASGYSESDGATIDIDRQQLVERMLGFLLLSGRHVAAGSYPWETTWQGNLSQAARLERDSRDSIYIHDPSTGELRFKSQPGSGQRYAADLHDTGVGGGINVAKPFASAKVKVGAAVQRTDRDLEGRRFRYRFVGDDPEDLHLPAETLLSADQVGTNIRIQEDTLQEDAYTASLQTLAGYVSGEYAVTKSLRISAGARLEAATQKLDNGTPFAVAGNISPVDRNDIDVLPAVNGSYALSERTNLRAGYSYSLVRPRFRELAPFLYFDYIRRRSISGNPNLINTHIHNADLRWEFFPSEDEVFSASLFYKRFVDPIEQVLANSEADVTFANAAGADLYGAEMEGRLTLGRLTPALSKFFLGANIAIMKSAIDVEGSSLVNTSSSRPLYGQSPFVINASLQYRDPKVIDVSLSYNVSGKRISEVGVDGLPDTYEMPLHKLDITASKQVAKEWRVKISGSNLLADTQLFQQGNVDVNNVTLGTTISASIEWAPAL